MRRDRSSACCPRACPRRCAVPNCHDPETCAVWAAYLAKKQVIAEGRRRAELERSVMTQGRVQTERRRERDLRRRRR